MLWRFTEASPMTDQEKRPAPAELAADHDQPAPGREADMGLKPDGIVTLTECDRALRYVGV
jgi:hypothetical protein